MQQLPIFVLVVDDHELTRISLKLLLSRQQNIRVVGSASNGKEAVELAKQFPPDVAILDLQMPVMDGLSAAYEIKKLNRHTQVIAYSCVEDPQAEVMSQTVPVDLFYPKDISSEILLNSVLRLGRQAQKFHQGFCQRFH
ncbi:MAG: response regulator transcription factor [Cyanophyceae cyanobacterium]